MKNPTILILFGIFRITLCSFSQTLVDFTIEEINESNTNLEACRTKIKDMPIPVSSEFSLDTETINNEQVNLITMFLSIRSCLLEYLLSSSSDFRMRNKNISATNVYYQTLVSPCTINNIKILYEKLYNKSIVMNELNGIRLLKEEICLFMDDMLAKIIKKNQTKLSEQEISANTKFILIMKAVAFIFNKDMFLDSHSALILLTIQQTAKESYENYKLFNSKIKYLIRQYLIGNYQDMNYITLIMQVMMELWFQYDLSEIPMVENNGNKNNLKAFIYFIQYIVRENQDMKIFTIKMVLNILTHLSAAWYEVKIYEEEMYYIREDYNTKVYNAVAIKYSRKILGSFMDNIKHVILNRKPTPHIGTHLYIFIQLLKTIYCDENNFRNYNEYRNYLHLVNLYSKNMSTIEYKHSNVINEYPNVCSALIGLFFHALNDNYKAVSRSIKKIVRYSWHKYFGNGDKSLSVKNAIENIYGFIDIRPELRGNGIDILDH